MRRRPSNAPPTPVIPQLTSAEQLLQDIAERRRVGTALAEEPSCYMLCVIDEHGRFSVLRHDAVELLRATIVSYIGRDVTLAVFVGAQLGISEANTSQPLLRYLMLPGRDAVPLFDTPAELRPDRDGYVGQPYRVLTTPMELREETDDEAAPPAETIEGTEDTDSDSIV